MIFAISAMVFIGMTDLVRRRGMSAGGSPASYLAIESIVLAAFAIVVAFARDGGLNLSGEVLSFAPLSALFIGIGIVFFLTGLGAGEATRVAPLGRMGFVVTFILAALLLGESVTLTKALGVALAVGAAILLSS